MPHADVDGQRLFYEDSGGSGPTVAFSHGLFMDHSMFDAQVEALRERYRCVAWDERGHGQTGEATAPFTYWDSADDLAGLLASLDVDSAVLAGMSQGGYLSLRAALAHPGIVRGLILIDTQATPEAPEKIPYYQELVGRWLEQGMDDELAATIEAIILGQGYAGAERWRSAWKRHSAANVQQVFQTLAGREDISDRLDEIDVPAIVIHGSEDAAVDLESAQALADGLPDAELVVIDGAGHASNLTHPDQVTPHIERFLHRFD